MHTHHCFVLALSLALSRSWRRDQGFTVELGQRPYDQLKGFHDGDDRLSFLLSAREGSPIAWRRAWLARHARVLQKQHICLKLAQRESGAFHLSLLKV